MGYAGGSKPTPTYRSMGDHTEAIEVTYDPARISYEELLAVFWSAHQPTHEPWSRQYRSAIWPADPGQRAAAEASKAAREAELGRPLFTAIEAPTAFTAAEDYHQKYRLRQDELLEAELRARFDSEEAFYRSTEATRLNAYLGGDGTVQQLLADLEALGLSKEAERRLIERVGGAYW